MYVCMYAYTDVYTPREHIRMYTPIRDACGMYVFTCVCMYDVCMYVYVYIRYTWVRTVALPLFEGKEISHNMAGTLTIEQAATHSQKSFFYIFI